MLSHAGKSGQVAGRSIVCEASHNEQFDRVGGAKERQGPLYLAHWNMKRHVSVQTVCWTVCMLTVTCSSLSFFVLHLRNFVEIVQNAQAESLYIDRIGELWKRESP